MERKRTVHQLDTPFSVVQWPQVSRDDQDTILELLCSLLSPLGHHRKSFIAPSRGKRAKWRKRKTLDPDAATEVVPAAPEVANYIDPGLASISRRLEKISAVAGRHDGTGRGTTSEESVPEPYAVVFVARSGQPSAFHSHFPQMVAVASKALPQKQSIRLVGFSAACEERLSRSLGVPRVSSIGLLGGAPQAQALVDFVREHVPPVDMSWSQEAGRFLGTNISAIEVPIGTKKQKT